MEVEELSLHFVAGEPNFIRLIHIIIFSLFAHPICETFSRFVAFSVGKLEDFINGIIFFKENIEVIFCFPIFHKTIEVFFMRAVGDNFAVIRTIPYCHLGILLCLCDYTILYIE